MTASACVRLLGMLVALIVAALPFSVSAAAFPDQGQAYAACMVKATDDVARNPTLNRNPTCRNKDASGTTYANAYWACTNYRNSGSSEWLSAFQCTGRFDYPAGTTCSTRVDGDVGMINGTLYSAGVCDNGCKVNPNLDRNTDFSMKESGNPNIISIRSGTWKATGAVCSPLEGEQKPEKKDEFCHTTSSGHTVCKSKDKTCVSTASGFRTCASDTGNTKGHIETNKGRTEATSISAPDTPPSPPANRPGEDWQQTGNSTNITNNTKNTGNTSNNYYNNGKPNGNDKVPGDGSGPGAGGSNGNGNGNSGGDGEGNESSDSAADSGNCTAPPQCTGDTLKCLQLTYTWKVQCNTKGAEVTGGEGCTDADVPVCAGSTCKAETYASLLQQWRQRCAAKSMADGMSDRAGKISNPDDDGVVNDIWIKESPGSGPKLRQDLISVGGSGPLLPNVSLEGVSWEPPPQFYDAITGVKFLIIAMCTVMAMFIVGRNM